MQARFLRFWVAVFVFVACLCACNQPARHQKGGSASQSFGAAPSSPNPPANPKTPAPVPSQSLNQPENPLGNSTQSMSRTTTTTAPDGSVVTTVERADTVIGGSQDLADILKEYASGQYMGRLMTALVMGLVAWLIRKEWPLAAMALGVGALVVARFGEVWALAFAALAAGLFIAYHVVTAKLGRGLL